MPPVDIFNDEPSQPVQPVAPTPAPAPQPAPVAPVVQPAPNPGARRDFILNLALVGMTVFFAVLWYQSGDRGSDGKPRPKPTDNLHVLLVEERNDRKLISQDQIDILTGAPFKDWCYEHCGKDADNDPAFRCFDQNDDLSGLSDPVWQQMMDAAKGSKLPCMVAGSPQSVEVVPLQKNTEEAIKYLETRVKK